MGRLDEVTLEELYELKEQIDEGKPREQFSRRSGASKAISWIHWLTATVSLRKRSATGCRFGAPNLSIPALHQPRATRLILSLCASNE